LTGAPEAEAANLVEAAYASLPYPSHLLKLGEGAKEVVKKLWRTYLLGIATSRRSRGIDVFFEFSKMKKYFGAAVGYEDVERLKPHPDPLLLAAKRLGIEPANAVYVGDAATDMEAANAAGMYAIAYGHRRHPGAHQQVSTFFHLPEAVKRLYY
jgi:HAD superfamily hydrolase (TIGR01549 family)